MMEDVPQPSSTRYEVGNHVQIYIGEDGPDVRWHRIRCRVVDVLEDDLAFETDRELDGILYCVESLEDGEELPVDFRHGDHVPIE